MDADLGTRILGGFARFVFCKGKTIMYTASPSGVTKVTDIKSAKDRGTSEKKPLTQELVKLRTGMKFVLIFGCPRKYVPDGIQVLSAGGGNSGSARQDALKEARFGKVKADLDGLMSRCVVDSINVRESVGFCRVYVNCTVGISDTPGLHFWSGGAYEAFVRKSLAHTWGRAILKEQGDRISLEMRNVMSGGDAAVKLRFAIE